MDDKNLFKAIGIKLILLISFFSTHGQNNDEVQKLNAFKYAIISPLIYDKNGKVDCYGVRSELIRILYEKGFKVFYDSGNATPPKEFILNSRQILHWTYYHNFYQLEVDAKDLNGNKIFYKTIDFYKATKIVYKKDEKEYSLKLSKALKKILKPLDKYKFEESASAKFYPIPKVEISNETEESLIKYFTESQLDPIEGIYKNIESKNSPYYRIGLKKVNQAYVAIIIETNAPYWSVGEIKARFEKLQIYNVYSTSYWLSNKERVETLAELNDLILTINQKNPVDGAALKFAEFIKVFPIK